MNSIQIRESLKSDKITRNYFIGVLARDQLPLSVNWPCCFILNTDKSNKPGEHWLAFYYDDNGVCDFFDSFGNSPSYYRLLKYLEKTSTDFNYNNKQIQSIFSTNCGHYCLMFLYYRCRNKNLNEIKQMFSNLPEKNDEMINKMIEEC